MEEEKERRKKTEDPGRGEETEPCLGPGKGQPKTPKTPEGEKQQEPPQTPGEADLESLDDSVQPGWGASTPMKDQQVPTEASFAQKFGDGGTPIPK